MVSKNKANRSYSHAHGSLTKESIVALLIKIFGIISGYLMFLVLSRLGGAGAVGSFSIGYNLINLLAQLSLLGLPMAVLRFAGPMTALRNWIGIKGLYRNSAIIATSGGLVVGLALFLLSKTLSETYYGNPSLATQFRYLSLSIVFFNINLLNVSFLRSVKGVSVSQPFHNFLIPLLSTILIIICALLSAQLHAIFLYLVAILVVSVASTVVFHRVLTNRIASGISNHLVDDQISMVHLLKVSSPMMITSFSTMLMGQISIQFIGILMTENDVGIYQIALKVAMTTSLFLQSINIAVGPRIADLFWNGKRKQLQSTIQKGARLIFFSSSFLLLIIVVFSKFILGVFGQEFVEGRKVLIILCMGQFINAFCGSVGYYMNMTGRQKELRNFVLISLIGSALLNYLLIANFGIIGASIASTMGIFVWNFLSVLFVAKKDKIFTFFWPKSV